jgi:hypothetical protein
MCVSVYKSFELHLDVSAYKSPAHAVPVGVHKKFFLLLRFVSKQICLFRLFRYMFETPNQTGYVKQTGKQPRQIEFQFFKVQTENISFVSRTPFN